MPNPTERAIFLQAIEEENLDDRAAYLASACGGDESLRAAVDALLVAHDQPATLLDHPIGADGQRPAASSAGFAGAIDHIGMQIGPYKLKEQIGEGGFGLVFVAEQQQPVRRKVALKIVKPGLGSKEVIARFEAERQAVAMMNHPNIAQVYDVGVTSDGRPYFVMELVRGLPIGDFCDKQKLSLTERLELMIDVCSAVHHAHQKGIIHRDLKPSNVMVTLHDAKPVAKVIDFGIAKALGEKLTDKSIYTRFFSMIGTPLYMSPEQAEMSGLDVDTRSDIYSLGVTLYELLAGTTPFDRDRLDSVGLDELRRIIREEEPPPPSTRLSTRADELSTIADQRRISSSDLTRVMQGDLDWVVMKALEKDRSRRYDSAAALADDLRRYLDGNPVEARPPSSLYLLQKYARRHRAAFVSGALVAIALVLGMAASLWQMSKAIEERNAKVQALNEVMRANKEKEAASEKVKQFANNLVRSNELVVSGQAHADAGRLAAASQDYDAAVSIQPTYYLPRVQRALLYTRLGLWPEAANDYAMAIDMGAPTSQPQWWGVPALYLYTGYDDAYRRISAQRRETICSDPQNPQWMLLRDLAVGEGLTSGPDANDAVDPQRFVEIAGQWSIEPEFHGRPKPPPMDPQSRRPPDRSPDGTDRSVEGPSRPPRDFRGPPGDFRRPPGEPGRPPGDPRRGPRMDSFGPSVPFDGAPKSVRRYITALVYLRAGEYDAAINELDSIEQDTRWPAVYLVHAPRAIACYRIGDIANAGEALERSDRAIRDWLSKTREQPMLGMEAPWFDLVEGLLINREAWMELRGTPSPLASQLDERRAESLSLIHGSQP